MSNIIGFLQTIADFLASIGNFIIDFFTDLGEFLTLLTSSVVGIPNALSILPGPFVAIIVTAVGVLVLLRVLGRDD